ncbi:carbohydrate ABC transporter permease [Candidatus Caldatribacterium saccharofermentans]|uniref:carbohydrate ABC transporter permease n=1 Tax=Candidatus Caldatribacterium saccharofermentans TaxID=1454753 RepID=UPI003D0837A6
MSWKSKRSYRSYKRAQVFTGYLFVLPDLIGLVVFYVVPVFLAVYLGLHEWSGFGEMRYVGFANFRNMVADALFVRSLWTTFKLVVLFLPLNFAMSLGLALLVQVPSRAVSVFRTIYFTPVAISAVSVGLIWRFMFQSHGVVNALLTGLGLPRQPLLGSSGQALPILISTILYQSVGYYMVIFIAGLNDIPLTLYEAARVDGAEWFQRFKFITLPLLKPVILFVLVISLLNAFQVFDQIQILTAGGPAYATTTTVFYAYRIAFEFYKFGYGAAINFIVFLMQLMISLLMFRVMRGGRIEE